MYLLGILSAMVKYLSLTLTLLKVTELLSDVLTTNCDGESLI
jgi:hypothetical protein